MEQQTFGRLTVIEQSHRNAQGRVFWRCQCACGKEAFVSGTRLRTGATRSCGCLRVEVERGTHGMSKTPTYSSWVQMRHRCNNPTRGCYSFYGGRGITICKRWDSFETFHADMGDCPPGMTLERIKNHRGYSPSNCRWATRKEQARNTRRNVNLTFKGRTQSVAAWAEQLGMCYGTIYTRHRAGWPVARILQGVSHA